MKKIAFVKYILSLLMFGSNGIVAHYIDLSSLEIVMLRTVLAGLLLSAIFFLSGGKLTLMKHKRQIPFLLMSGMAMGASWMFLYEAYTQVGVSIASLLFYCGPIIVVAVSPLLFRERLTAGTIAGFAVVVTGVLLINGNVFEGSGNLFGIGCGLMSAVMYAAMVICSKYSRGIVGLENAMFQLIMAFLSVTVFVGLQKGLAIRIPASSILPMLILGLVNTGLGCYFYFSSLRRLKVKTISICGYMEPLSAVVFSMLILGEAMLPLQLLGAAMIIGGAIIGEFTGKRKAPSHAGGAPASAALPPATEETPAQA